MLQNLRPPLDLIERKAAGESITRRQSSWPMGRQMVEQEWAKGHLRAVRVTAKVILGPFLPLAT